MAQEPWVELGDAVAAVRAELQRAAAAGAGESLRFRTGPVELEFSVEVRKDADARTRVMVLPWSADARAAHSATSAHRLKLVLQPVDEQGQDVTVSALASERPR